MPEPDVQTLLLAFTYHMTQQIIRADAEVEPSEEDYLSRTFPPSYLESLGLLDEHGRPTAAFDEARDLAMVELPGRLTLGEKLSLIEVLVGAAAADGVLAAEEADALHGAARMLGVDDAAWSEHLAQLIASGRVHRDDAGV